MEQGQIEDRQVNRDLPHEKPQYLVIATRTHLIPGERISIPRSSEVDLVSTLPMIVNLDQIRAFVQVKLVAFSVVTNGLLTKNNQIINKNKT